MGHSQASTYAHVRLYNKDEYVGQLRRGQLSHTGVLRMRLLLPLIYMYPAFRW